MSSLSEQNEQNEAELRQKVQELEDTIHTLEKDLIHDQLTGLKTRAFFEEEAKTYLEVINHTGGASKRKKWFGFKNISFIFFDIDFFKRINDTYGHQQGDEVLKEVANVIRTSVREGDTAARWGGEEMALTLVGATEKDAVKKAEDIRARVEDLHFNKLELKVTLSAGVSTAKSGESFEEVLRHADEALYKAKGSGRNRVITYSETNHGN